MFGLIRGLFWATILSAIVYLWTAAAGSFVFLDMNMFDVTAWSENGRGTFAAIVTLVTAAVSFFSYLIWDEEEDNRRRRERVRMFEAEAEARRLQRQLDAQRDRERSRVIHEAYRAEVRLTGYPF